MPSALENVTLNPGTGGEKVAVDTVSDGQVLPANVQAQAVKVLLGASGVNDGLVDAANPLPVSGTIEVSSVADPVVVASVTDPVTVASVTSDVAVVGTDADGASATGAPVLTAGKDASGDVRALDVRYDSTDGIRRLQVEGRVSVTAPTAPPSTTAVTITFSGALSISSTATDNYTITNGKKFVLQQVIAGSEGDTSERGSVVEVFYYDGSTERIIERVYLNGFTTAVYPNAATARDGTAITGNGTTKTIRLRRRRLSGSAQEVDAVLRGYEYTP